MKRTITTAAAVALATVSVAACGSSSKTTSPTTTTPTTAAAPAAGATDTGAATATTGAASTDSSAPAVASGPTIASKLILGAPPEFKTRADGIAGLTSDYNVTFGAFKALDAGGPLTINALKNGQVDAGDIFTTDPSIKADNFVVLTDPKSLYTAQNVLPLINKAKDTPAIDTVLNAVSAKLTTDDLVSLNTDVITNKKDPVAVADAFLTSKGLDTKGTSLMGTSLVVGSANFQENAELAEIYIEALKDNGASVTPKLNIGSRETYIPGLMDGSIDLIPEYSGVLLQYFDKTATAITSDDVFTALGSKLPSTLAVLTQSAAEDKDAIVVTAATAAKYKLTSIADLANPAS